MIKTIWFDFGGVLSPPIEEIFNIYYHKTNIKPEQLKKAMLDVANNMGMPMLAPIENAILTEFQWGKSLRKSLKKLYPQLDTSKARLEYFGEQWFENINANEKMIELFKKLKKQGYMVGILTNNVVEWEKYWKAIVRLDEYTDFIVDSCKFGCRKPDRAFFEIAQNIAKTKPNENLLIDDVKENCISAGVIGWKSILFIDNKQVCDDIKKILVLNQVEKVDTLDLPYITDIPEYDFKPTYTIISKAQENTPEIIKILSGHKVYHITKYEDVKIILDSKYCIRKPSNQVGGASVLPTLTPNELLLNLDNDEHKRLKHFAMKEYSHSALAFLKKDIKNILTKNMQPYLVKKHFDLFKILDDSILEINAKLLGINPKLYKDFLKPLSKNVQIANPNDTDSLIRDFMQIYNFILEIIQDTNLIEANGIINKWVKNKNSATPPLNDKEICALLLGSVLGGYQNMLTIISKLIYALLFFPELWALLLRDQSILDNMINELLRLTNLGTTSTFPRITIADIKLSSFTIPKDSVVYANVFLANRDALIFENPLQINPFRKTKQHLQFGRGIHSCMGQHFVKLETQTIIQCLMDILPNIQLDKTKQIQWDNGIILHRPQSIPIIKS
ncbi:MAG: cytochrome P450 [Helicobacter sp.]|uniref:cytochrome P450 n=1 Tax=Helicobacter sp. TaxID=218 RepID=UPI002A91C46C|nr:cytochrome P450 [Helicobacter sp.]MDY5822096.1 cytochrome P450 [Helicobacter sp.]